MSKKALSLDEKKTRLVQLFHETNDFFTIKELEKVAPKQKGITEKTVKEVLMDVISENKVKTDKIGTGVYYWSFTSEQEVIARRNYDDQVNESHSIRTKKEEVSHKVKELEAERFMDSERAELYPRLQAAKHLQAEYTHELRQHRNTSNQRIEQMQRETALYKTCTRSYSDAALEVFSYACGITSTESQTAKSHLLQGMSDGLLDDEAQLEMPE